ncbi:unnamed protein product [Heterobilharzia americana]|nr:unnamed protein product [Heterobilharzia americana]
MYYTEVIDHRRIAEYMFMKRYTLLIQQCLLNWKYYITVKQALYMKSLHFKESLKNKLRQQYLHQWLDNLHYKKSIECLINHFQEVKTIQFMKKIFVAWFKWVRTRHTHQLHTQMIFNHAVQLLHNLRIRLYFIHWKSTHRYYSNCQLAQNLYSKHKLIQCFSAWLTYILIKKKRMKLKYIADNYRNQSIQNYVLKYWHSKFIEAKHMQTLNYIAVVRWSLYLQARVWQGWRLWIIKRNEKKSKRVIAMQRFIQHRTVDALRLWISMGLYRRHERHLEYCSKFWNNNSRVFNLILNITTHWYWWTLSRMDYKRSNENKSTLCCQEEISSLTHNYNRLDKCLQFINNIHITHNGDIMFGLRNHHQLTPPRYPDFILSELQSLQFTDQFLPISTDIGESDKQMHYETLNPDEIRCSTPICLSRLRVQDINLYINSLEEKIYNYKMMKSMYTIMRKRFHLEDRHRNEVNNNDEKVISLRKRIKEEKAECISLIKELRLLFKHQHHQQPYQYVT